MVVHEDEISRSDMNEENVGEVFADSLRDAVETRSQNESDIRPTPRQPVAGKGCGYGAASSSIYRTTTTLNWAEVAKRLVGDVPCPTLHPAGSNCNHTAMTAHSEL